MIEPTILNFEGGALCGASEAMSLQTFTPWTLWPKVMPQLSRVSNRKNKDLISLRAFEGIPVFGPTADPNFTYWGGAEVTGPKDGLEHLEIPAGTYAVFHYKGLSNDSSIWRFIYSQWLPNSEWELDDRPHFERLGSKYKNDDPTSEEDIYIPIRPKK
jgi:AraC family transcriptional regulator